MVKKAKRMTISDIFFNCFSIKIIVMKILKWLMSYKVMKQRWLALLSVFSHTAIFWRLFICLAKSYKSICEFFYCPHSLVFSNEWSIKLIKILIWKTKIENLKFLKDSALSYRSVYISASKSWLTKITS